MQVLFLDIDGVLNSHQSANYYLRLNVENGGLTDFSCPIARSNLHTILDEFPSLKIVVSSAWRIGETLESMQGILCSYALIRPNRVIGMTPILRAPDGHDKARGYEIEAWLKQHPEVTSFVIVDDDGDMAHLKPHLVQTDGEHGLMYKDAVKIMNKFHLPWEISYGYELSKLKDSEGLDHSAERLEEGGIKTTFWGKKEGFHLATSLDDWAVAKVVESKRRFNSYKVFIKADRKPLEGSNV